MDHYMGFTEDQRKANEVALTGMALMGTMMLPHSIRKAIVKFHSGQPLDMLDIITTMWCIVSSQSSLLEVFDTHPDIVLAHIDKEVYHKRILDMLDALLINHSAFSTQLKQARETINTRMAT